MKFVPFLNTGIAFRKLIINLYKIKRLVNYLTLLHLEIMIHLMRNTFTKFLALNIFLIIHLKQFKTKIKYQN